MTYEADGRALGQRADADVTRLSSSLSAAEAAVIEQRGTIAAKDATIGALQAEVARLQAIIDAGNPPPPTPPPAASMKYGTTAPSGIDTLESAVGVRFAIRRSYEKSIPTFTASEAAKDVGKRASALSVKNADWSNAGIAAGVAALKRLGSSWPKDHSGALMVNHEPENDGKPAAAFVTWQRAAVEAWKSVNTHVPIGGCLMSYSTRPGSGRNPEEWICDDWDFLAWDGYSHPPNPPKASEIFGPCLTINMTHNLPFAVAEYATEDSGSKWTWTEGVAEFVAAANGLFCCYWNSTGTNLPYPWTSDLYPKVKTLALKYGGTAL